VIACRTKVNPIAIADFIQYLFLGDPDSSFKGLCQGFEWNGKHIGDSVALDISTVRYCAQEAMDKVITERSGNGTLIGSGSRDDSRETQSAYDGFITIYWQGGPPDGENLFLPGHDKNTNPN
jgi:hypothetical protein